MGKSILFIIILFLIFSSCETINKTRVEAFVMKEQALVHTWVLTSIEVSAKSINNNITHHALEIFPGIAKQSGVNIINYKDKNQIPSEPYLIAHIKLSEKEFTKGLDTLNSIFAVLSLSEPDTENRILQVLYTEVSDSTIESDYHLYEVLSQLCLKTEPLLKLSETKNP